MKRALIKVTPQVFGMFVTSTSNDCVFYHIEGAPKDSKFIGVYYKHEENCFYVCMEHDSFDDIPEGNKSSSKEIKIATYYA